LAMEISLTSLGSSQTLRWPHFMTDAARRFCILSDTILSELTLCFLGKTATVSRCRPISA